MKTSSFAFALLLGAIGAGAGFWFADNRTSEVVPVNAPARITAAPAVPVSVAPPSAEAIRYSLSPIVKRVAPAVVNVYASRAVPDRVSLLMNDPFFHHFFGEQAPSRRAQQSLGSGVIVDPSGIIVTNLHVIAEADEVRIVLADQREVEAEILLKDRQSDLAVLRLKTRGNYPFLELADSNALEVGDLVLAIGNPFGVGQTVTSGIISALARSRITRDDEKFYVQTDAAINPGNSGGGLIDADGRLIGINTAIFSPSGASSGIGFAVPSNMVRVVLNAANSGDGRVRRPWLGASFQPVTPDVAAAIGVDRPVGALVNELTPAGPAAEAGLQPGDLITHFDGKSVTDPGMLSYELATAGLGRTARLQVVRGGRAITVSVSLTPAPETVPRAELKIGGRSPFTGATVVNLSPAVADEMSLATRQAKGGVVIVEVEGDSPAGRVRLQRGDIIVEVNGVRIDKTSDLQDLSAQGARIWRFAIEREGRVMRSQLYGG